MCSSILEECIAAFIARRTLVGVFLCRIIGGMDVDRPMPHRNASIHGLFLENLQYGGEDNSTGVGGEVTQSTSTGLKPATGRLGRVAERLQRCK